jgi:hypothetical protein
MPQAPEFLLAKTLQRLDEAAALKGWWVSEKYDGLRAYWDGERLEFTPGQPLFIFENLSLGEKAKTPLVVGINGDVTHTSFPFDETFNTVPEEWFSLDGPFTIGCLGSVGASLNSYDETNA